HLQGPSECWDLTKGRSLAYRTDVKRVLAQNGRFLAITKDESIVELRERFDPIPLGHTKNPVAITCDARGLVALAAPDDDAVYSMVLGGYDDQTNDLPHLYTLNGLNPHKQLQLASDGSNIWVLGAFENTPKLLGLDFLERPTTTEHYRVNVPRDAVLVSGPKNQIGLLTQTRRGLHFVWLNEEPPDLATGPEVVTFPRRKEIFCDFSLGDTNPKVAALVDAMEERAGFDHAVEYAREMLAQNPGQSLAALLLTLGTMPNDLWNLAEELAPGDPYLSLVLADKDAGNLQWKRVERRLDSLNPEQLSSDMQCHYHHLRVHAHAWFGRLEEARAASRTSADSPEDCDPDDEVLEALTRPDDPVAQLAQTLGQAHSLELLGAQEVWHAQEVQTILRRGRLILDAWDDGEASWLDTFLAVSAVVQVSEYLRGSLPTPNAIEGDELHSLVKQGRAWLDDHHRAPERRAELLLDEVRGCLRVRFRLTYDEFTPSEAWVVGPKDTLPRDLLWEETVANVFSSTFGNADEATLTGDTALDFLANRLPKLAHPWTV
ncbi:MAG: hypothetical protein HN348_31270, partial [Proteobacteria bacterium]|nr:hypothetical protein [Pseudomonadota bacterium]